MILETMLDTIRQHKALVSGERVIVAVSGGGDSVALLHLLKRAKKSLACDLHVASLDHGIREEAGKQDLAFVESLANQWGIPCTVGRVDVPTLSREWGIGIEAAARRARYAFLARVAAEQESACVAVGHHAMDQAETIIMNIARGSGNRGLCGMQVSAAMPNHPGMRLLRPLLYVSKEDLAYYCSRHSLPYRADASNADIKYRRNFVRHEVISRLQTLNPQLLHAFERLSESAAVDEDFISSQFAQTVIPLLRLSAEGWQLEQSKFNGMHSALKRRLLQNAFRQLTGGSPGLSYALTLDLITWAGEATAGDRRDMGAGIQMRKGYDSICIERKDAKRPAHDYRLIPADTDRYIPADSPLNLYGLHICLSTDRPAVAGDGKLALPADAKPRLRTRRRGDRFRPKGMGGHSRKIKDWMIDRKVPRALRDQIPLICADGEIIAICLGDVWHLADTSRFDSRIADYVMLTLA